MPRSVIVHVICSYPFGSMNEIKCFLAAIYYNITDEITGEPTTVISRLRKKYQKLPNYAQACPKPAQAQNFTH